MPKTDQLDPVTLEIIQGKLLSIVDEMGVVMQRTSMSPVIYEVLDFACGICDAKLELIAQTNGITLFTGTFSTQLRSVVEIYRDDMQPGDMFVTNDPYHGGTHACDFAIIRPIFSGDDLVAYALNVAHWVDVGGAVPGSLPPNATSTFQEGLRLSRIRLARGDVLNDEIVRIIGENTRLPEIAMGDLNAQIATVRIADQRFKDVFDRYGVPTVTASYDAIIEGSAERSRAVIRDLPDGVYTATDVIDGDGVSDTPIKVGVKITVKGETVEADFTGCPPALAGPINCGAGALQSAVKSVFKAMVAPREPSNEGWFRPLTVTAPSGTVFTAEKPSPTGWYYEGSVQASELVWQAMAPLMTDRVSAGSYSSLCVIYLSGRTPDGEEFIHIEPTHGGWGACQDQDGANAVISLTDGDTYNYSVELLEAKFPFRVRRYDFNVEGGTGAGRYRGGYGVVREYEVQTDDTLLTGSFGRNATPPWAIDGGHTGSLNRFEVVEAATGRVTSYGRLSDRRLKSGDIVRICTGGGGGWGDPKERSQADIKQDLRAGLISAETAKDIYGYEDAQA
ncbi:hydantoinase B/oxoprolinase family protein [Aliiroseovarius sp. 2305UL8-7]|uniref:hydantoinase B/oxoprolinase family protein n=1 Tax=Aliiroseovarius conchicola TaxID=3121637 RepID=UPI0035286A32